MTWPPDNLVTQTGNKPIEKDAYSNLITTISDIAISISSGYSGYSGISGYSGASGDLSLYSLVDGTRVYTGDIYGKSFIAANSVTINRTGDDITSIDYATGRILTLNRSGGELVSTEDAVHIWTINRIGGVITGVTVTDK